MGRHDWYFGDRFGKLVDFSDKKASAMQYVSYMLNRTQSMFKYTGLPDSLPQRNLELMLQTNGFIAIPIPDKVPALKGKLYAFAEGTSLGGERDVYYMPTICNIASPALNWSASLKIGEECIVIPNDSLYIGLLPMFSRYASMLAENDVTIRLADINARIINLLSAPDDRTRKSAEQYLKDVENGNLGVIADNAFLEGIKSQPYASSGSTNNITQLIELQQYLKAGWYNDVGLNANYNMKRESINSEEAQLNDDALLPLALDMLRMRKIGFDIVNRLCGYNIGVELNASWKVRQEEQEQTLDEVETPPEDNSTYVETETQTETEEVVENVEDN